jgi:hypothetical protein
MRLCYVLLQHRGELCERNERQLHFSRPEAHLHGDPLDVDLSDEILLVARPLLEHALGLKVGHEVQDVRHVLKEAPVLGAGGALALKVVHLPAAQLTGKQRVVAVVDVVVAFRYLLSLNEIWCKMKICT